MLKAITNDRAVASLSESIPGASKSEVLYRAPRLIADFKDFVPPEGATKKTSDGYDVRLGISGCPPTTNQVIFFTDDESYADDENSYEEDLCLVVRFALMRGTTLAPESS